MPFSGKKRKNCNWCAAPTMTVFSGRLSAWTKHSLKRTMQIKVSQLGEQSSSSCPETHNQSSLALFRSITEPQVTPEQIDTEKAEKAAHHITSHRIRATRFERGSINQKNMFCKTNKQLLLLLPPLFCCCFFWSRSGEQQTVSLCEGRTITVFFQSVWVNHWSGCFLLQSVNWRWNLGYQTFFWWE